jgi:hypothetical protein
MIFFVGMLGRLAVIVVFASTHGILNPRFGKVIKGIFRMSS